MAEANTTIDPNDLDSIDALLDEAEFDFDEAEQDGDLPDLDLDLDVEQLEPDVTSPAEDSEPESSQETAEDEELNAMLGLDDTPSPAAAVAPAVAAGAAAAAVQSLSDNDADDFISRRSQASQTTDELTVEEMDAIKKMIIGFGVGLIILLIVAIVFAAMAAFSSGTDAALNEKVTEIKEETEIARIAVQSNEKALRDLNRKLDALSFQVEQLSADMIAVNQSAQGGQVVERGGILPAPVATVPTPSPQVAAQVSQGLEDKVDSITRSLALAQRRIVEVNNRVTSLQQQQGTVLKSVKDIEKNMLEQQLSVSTPDKSVKKDEKESAGIERPQSAPTHNYRYQAPTGLMYQPAGSGVYP
ncbi:hypothetical protein [Thiomicrospira microaerophila]|uniref:hypothetical protein n=1 Tax=Thiomicrospira microaerophila TaxID=406020 RepID=UPI0005C8A658|nr:hypothetical protein [Thiomicrospira microaerophila]